MQPPPPSPQPQSAAASAAAAADAAAAASATAATGAAAPQGAGHQEFRSLQRAPSNKVSAGPLVPLCDRRLRLRHSSRLGSPPLLPRRYGHRLRRSGSPAAPVQRAFVPPPAQDNAQRLDDVRGARHEVREGDRVLIEEPGRVIIQEGGRAIIRHNDADRFRWQAQDMHTERRGADTVTVFERPDGSRIYTVTDESGRLLRRYRRTPDGGEIMIIDNRYSGPPSPLGYFVDLPPPVIRIPRERYIVDAQDAQPDEIDDALWAAPVDYIERPYTLDEIRYSLPLRERMPRVDLDTVTFDTGSWEVIPDQVERLAGIADIDQPSRCRQSKRGVLGRRPHRCHGLRDRQPIAVRPARGIGRAGAHSAVRGTCREFDDPRLRRAEFESPNPRS